MATLIVTANCWNSRPDRPGIKPIGTNTESSTSEIAMIGAVIWVIASLVASAGFISGFSAITRSTFSTTTMASSTTMPVATTSASKVTVLAEKPKASRNAKAPISAIGTTAIGTIVARQSPRNRNTTSTTSTKASARVVSTSWIVSCTKLELS